jgi:flagellar biosynthesis/type III secretory pathway protein FliH
VTKEELKKRASEAEKAFEALVDACDQVVEGASDEVVELEREKAHDEGYKLGKVEAREELCADSDDLLVLIPHLTAAYEHEITRRPWAAHIIQSHIDRLNGAE